MRRCRIALTTLALFAVPVMTAAASGTSTASASALVTCAQVKGSVKGTLEFRRCGVPKPDRKAFKTLKGVASAMVPGGTFTWYPGGQTVTVTAVGTSVPNGTCPTRNLLLVVKVLGTVTGGTSAITKGGETFSATVCETVKGKFSLAKGTVATF